MRKATIIIAFLVLSAPAISKTATLETDSTETVNIGGEEIQYELIGVNPDTDNPEKNDATLIDGDQMTHTIVSWNAHQYELNGYQYTQSEVNGEEIVLDSWTGADTDSNEDDTATLAWGRDYFHCEGYQTSEDEYKFCGDETKTVEVGGEEVELEFMYSSTTNEHEEIKKAVFLDSNDFTVTLVSPNAPQYDYTTSSLNGVQVDVQQVRGAVNDRSSDDAALIEVNSQTCTYDFLGSVQGHKYQDDGVTGEVHIGDGMTQITRGGTFGFTKTAECGSTVTVEYREEGNVIESTQVDLPEQGEEVSGIEIDAGEFEFADLGFTTSISGQSVTMRSNTEATGGVDSFEWNVDGDDEYEETGRETSYKYDSDGEKSITMRVTAGDSMETVTKTFTIETEDEEKQPENGLELYSTSITNNQGETVMNERNVKVSPNSQAYQATASVSNNGEANTEVIVEVKQNGEAIIEKSSNVRSNQGTTFNFEIPKGQIQFRDGEATITFQVAGTEMSETKVLDLETPEYEGRKIELGEKVTVQQGDSLIFKNSQLKIGQLQDNPLLAVQTGNGKYGTVTFVEDREGRIADLRFQDGIHYIQGCNYNLDSEEAEIVLSESENINCEETGDDEDEGSSLEAQIDLITENPQTGQETKLRVSVNQKLADKGYHVRIDGPEKSSGLFTSKEKTYTFTPETPGEYTIKILPKTLGSSLPFIGKLLQGGALTKQTITVSSQEQPAWKTYCQERGYNLENVQQQINCIQNEIVPEYFQESVGENPKIAESICRSLLNYEYSQEKRSCESKE